MYINSGLLYNRILRSNKNEPTNALCNMGGFHKQNIEQKSQMQKTIYSMILYL